MLKSEVENLRNNGVDKGRYLRDLSIQMEADQHEVIQMNDDRVKYLQKAIQNYIRCLQVGVRCFQCFIEKIDDKQNLIPQ